MAQRGKINMEIEKKAMPLVAFGLCVFSTMYFQLYVMQY